jgi:hypothetical protein
MQEIDNQLPRIAGISNQGKEAEDKDAIHYRNQEANQDRIEAIIERPSSLVEAPKDIQTPKDYMIATGPANSTIGSSSVC